MRTLTTILAAACLAACGTADTDGAGDTTGTTGSTIGAAPSADTGDPESGATTAGVPAGYVGVTDSEREADISTASYTATDGRWEVRTGPRHIVYSAGDTARGGYTASTTMELVATPEHAEAFGLFVGGTNLDQPSRRYTYFVVRHTGEFLVRVRDGAGTRNVTEWTASPAIPQGAPGASYRLAAQVGTDSVRFMVNDQPVATLPKADLPTDGIVGLRINHNLHLRVTPVAID